MSDMIRIYKSEEDFKKADNIFKKQTAGTATMEEAFKAAGPLSKGITLRQAIMYTQNHMRYLKGFGEFLEFLKNTRIPLVINSTGYTVTFYCMQEKFGTEKMHGFIGNYMQFGYYGNAEKKITEKELREKVKDFFSEKNNSESKEYDEIKATDKIKLGLKNEEAKASLILKYAKKHFKNISASEIAHIGDTMGDSGGILGIAKLGGLGIAFNYNDELENFLKNKIKNEKILGKIIFVNKKSEEADLQHIIPYIKRIDLQNHTIASDGELTPEELVDSAIKKGLSAIAITDHDSVASLKKAIKYSKGRNIEVIPGIELSCDDPLFSYDKIDILGLFVDFNNKKLINMMGHINRRREENKKQIIEKLRGFGYEIEYEDVKKAVKGTFGRPHIAKYLLKKYHSEFTSVADVFDKLIGVGKKAFIETRDRVPIKDAIKMIKESGGISILAHPGIYPKEDSVRLIDYFIDAGGDGIETYYPYNIICPYLNIDEDENKKLIDFYRKIAKSKKILESGGNDHHGNYRPTLGTVEVPYSVLENLKKRVPVS